jgi:diadenosine tetraphosphatase ApaH/serine/threonine PP2A family protein phosphatase
MDLLKTSLTVLASGKALIEVPAPTVIIGDLHGNIHDLIRILRSFPGSCTSESLLFLGDYVDRGPHSVPVITLLLALLCKHPTRVFLLRGNHEFSHINRIYGFYEEVMSLYQMEDVWTEFQTVFSYFPLAAVVDSKLFCVHGGLSPELTSLEQLAQLALPIVDYFDDPMLSDLVWSDPDESVPHFADNHRGSGVLFGTAAVREFLTDIGVRAMVRAHQCVDGCVMFAQNCGVTVFSSSEYSRMSHNRAGVVRVAGTGRIELLTLQADPAAEMDKLAFGFWKGLGVKRLFIRNDSPMQREATPAAQPVKPKVVDRFGSRKSPVVAPKKCQRIGRPSLGKLPAIPIDENLEVHANV